MINKIGKIPTVLYVVGYGRSGSTLLDRLLGSIDDFHSCGEIFMLWRKVLDHKAPCSCGEYLEDCPFWKSVLGKTFGNSPNNLKNSVRDFALFFYSTISRRNLVNLYLPRALSQSFLRKLDNIESVIKRLYRAIAEVSGARVIVDSSKYPLYAYFLSEINAVDLHLIHLVRDSRAVIYSNIRKKVVPQIGYTATQNPLRTSLAWNLYNSLAERLKQKHKYVRVHYEDLALNPKRTIIHILETLGLTEQIGTDRDKALACFKDENKVVSGLGHLVAGNAMRFKQGDTEIKLDNDWMNFLPLVYKFATTVVTAPFLIKYEYSLGWCASHER